MKLAEILNPSPITPAKAKFLKFLQNLKPDGGPEANLFRPCDLEQLGYGDTHLCQTIPEFKDYFVRASGAMTYWGGKKTIAQYKAAQNKGQQ